MPEGKDRQKRRWADEGRKESYMREINPQYPLPAGYLIASQTSHLQS